MLWSVYSTFTKLKYIWNQVTLKILLDPRDIFIILLQLLQLLHLSLIILGQFAVMIIIYRFCILKIVKFFKIFIFLSNFIHFHFLQTFFLFSHIKAGRVTRLIWWSSYFSWILLACNAYSWIYVFNGWWFDFGIFTPYIFFYLSLIWVLVAY